MKWIIVILTLLITTPSVAAQYTHGIAINPFRLFINPTSLSGGGETYTGTYSIFNKEQGIEHALPVLYASQKNDNNPLDLFTAEYQWRKYVQPMNDGINVYWGGFTKVAYIEAITRNNYELDSTVKLGVGAVLGWTYFKNNAYLSGNIQFGRYISGENSHFSHPSVNFTDKNDRALIVSIELFKFGYNF
ncbi:hypothetical protein GCM10008107_25320 [Psychrosphaera saromensis]|uniref:DUF3575 domain-containing protein n=1 Tax=Psychrosphaera saromensis TaxID=716813 RepID=A0A2S7UX35_9GAMM|nr:hypothetical protein [Psychrosphaera saromensis]PQJ54255.1 hypothetical protein BTO11_11715 [Psychrosphaera saromensis]GHB74752.1 hypothetical protein GCM10008107_25320 [Psychrosphaera saromensis]GLQ12645.1 hypothetical protein GCM10007917_01000 [Psychrosphaera saromensis]